MTILYILQLLNIRYTKMYSHTRKDRPCQIIWKNKDIYVVHVHVIRADIYADWWLLRLKRKLGTLKKKTQPGHKNLLRNHMVFPTFGNFWCLSYKDKIALKWLVAIRNFSGKCHSSCYPCMKGFESLRKTMWFNSKFQLSFLCPGCCPFGNFSMFGSTIGCVLNCPKDKLFDKSLQKG